MKRLKFSAPLVSPILSGEKFATWRLFDDKNLSVGDNLELINQETGELFGYAVITDVRGKKLADITEADYIGHERFASSEAMIAQYRAYYGDQVTPETSVKMIQFRYEGMVRPGYYRHYKNVRVRVIGVARHSETLESLVFYEKLEPFNGNPTGSLWVRPVDMFLGQVTVDGQAVPRFAYEGERE